MAVILSDNSKSSQIYTALIKKYIFPYATVTSLTKDAQDLYDHTVSGTEPKNPQLQNQKHVIILAEDFSNPAVADAVLLLSKTNFKSQITWYRKYIDMGKSKPATFDLLKKLMVSWKGRTRLLGKLLPTEGRFLIEDFLAVYYDQDNGSYWKELNHEKVLQLLSERTFRKHLTKLHMEAN